MTGAHRIGSAAWHEANPTAPTYWQAEADTALDRAYPAPYSPSPLTAAVDQAYAAKRGRMDGTHVDARDDWRNVARAVLAAAGIEVSEP